MSRRWWVREGVPAGIGLLMLGGALLGMTARGQERESDWFKVVSPGFELYGNGRESEARRLLRELETFRYVVSRFLGLTNVQRRPAMVFLFEDDRSFVPYKPVRDGKPWPVSGYHTGDPLDDALALGRQEEGEETRRVMFHEYTHLLTARQFRHAPLWAIEGVAEVFSTFEEVKEQFNIGVALTNHVFYLRRRDPAPVLELLSVRRESREYNEQERAGRFYASSWLLTHYLLFGRRGFESNVMARYAAMCATSTNQMEAFVRAFGGGPRELEVQMRRYLRDGSYTVVRQTYPELESVRPRKVAMVRGEWDYALGRLLQMTARGREARPRLERALAGAPQDPRPAEALALLGWREGRREDVEQMAEWAIRRGSRDGFVHFLAAESRYQGLPGTEGVARTAGLREGKRLCERAVELDPWLAPAHHLLGVYVLALNPRTPALALVHVQQALRCDPQYKPAFLTWASLLAAQGNFGMARQVLTRMLDGPLTPELRARATEVAAQVDARLGVGGKKTR